jgi:uncharacterized protein YndB with AHSA1/START domain
MDIDRMLGSVDRQVETREDGARATVSSRTYATDIDDLWDAITNGERLPRWFLPVSGDLRLGGHYQLEGNASGEIRHCVPPRELGVTWVFDNQVSYVNVRLSEVEDGTHLRLEHVADIADEFWDRFGAGAGGVGWDMALMGLAEHVSTNASVTPENAMEWMVSEEGRRFIRRSSDAWRDASIRAGTDRDAAQAAGDRTTAFYMGEEPGAET